MSEPVEITGVAWSGNLKEWATEKTQADVLEVLRDTMKLNEEQLKVMQRAIQGMTNGDKKEAGDALTNVSRKIRANKPRKEEKKTLLSNNSARKTNTTSIIKNNMAMAIMTGSVTLLGTAIWKLTEALFQQVNNYDKAVKAGLNFERAVEGSAGGFRNMTTLSDEINLSYKEMIGTMAKFSKAVTKYGEGRFVDTIRSTRDAMLGFGLSTSETTEYLGKYLDQRHRMDLIQSMTQRQVDQSFVESMKSISKWSQALGKSREEILEGLGDTLKSADVTAFMSTIGDPDHRKRVESSITNLTSALGDPKLSQLFMRAMTSEIPQMDPEIQALMQSGAHDMVNTILSVRKSLRAGNIGFDEAANIVNKLNDNTGTMVFNMNQLSQFTGEAGLKTRELALAAQESARNLKNREPVDKEAMKASARFRSSLENLRSIWQQIIGGAGASIETFDMFTRGVETIANTLDENSEAISGIIQKFLVFVNDAIKTGIAIFDQDISIEDRLTELMGLAFSKLGEIAGNAIIDAFLGLGSMIVDGWVKIFEWLFNLTKEGVLKALKFSMGDMMKSLMNLSTTVIDWVFGADLSGFMNDMLKSIKDKLKGFFSNLLPWGNDDDEDITKMSKEQIAENKKKRAAVNKMLAESDVPFSDPIKKFTQLDGMMNKTNENINFPYAANKKPDNNEGMTIVKERERIREQVAKSVEKEKKKEEDDSPGKTAFANMMNDTNALESMSNDDMTALLEKLIGLNHGILNAITENNVGQKRLTSIINNKDDRL